MPFYEYECQSCKFYTEVMQKITDAPLEKCPSCGKKSLKKLVSAPVFRLKGEGWYETDFKSDKENKRNLAGADQEESKAEPKSEAKDTKTAPAPAAAAGSAPAESTRKSGSVSTKPASLPATGKSSAAKSKPKPKLKPKPKTPARKKVRQ